MSGPFVITAFLAIGLLAVGYYAVRDRAEGRHRPPVVD